MAGGSEHHAVARRRAAVGVGAGVVGSGVRLDLAQPHRDLAVPDHRAQQSGGDLEHRAGQELSQGGRTAHGDAPPLPRPRRAARGPATGAVPPRPERDSTEPCTVSTSCTAGVRWGEISASWSSLSSWSSMPSSSQRRTQAPATSWATRKGTPSRTSHSAMSVASEKPWGASSARRARVELQGGDHARERRQQHLQGVDGVEDRLLVLLEVAVVGEGQCLQGGHQPAEVADQAAGLAAGELGDVGVLLLRHDARPRRPGVVEGDEPELPGRPEDDLLGEPAHVDADLGGDVGELGDEVARRRAVDRVGAGTGEAELGGDQLRVEPEAVAGQRSPAVRRLLRRTPASSRRAGRRRAAAARRGRAGGATAAPAARAGGGSGPASPTGIEVVARLGGQHVDQVEHQRGDGRCAWSSR